MRKSRRRVDNLTIAELRARGFALLARRDHSTSELRRKLCERGAAVDAVEAILEEMQDAGWLDDQRFAENYTLARARKGFGPVKIRHELRERGIKIEQRLHVPQEIAEDWLRVAELARHKRFGSGIPSDAHGRARQMRFLQNRGFSAEQVHELFRGLDD